MVTFPYSETVTRIRPAANDRFGDPVGPPTDVDIAGCAVWPLGSSGNASSRESQNRSDEIATGRALLAPPGTDLQPTDQIRYRDELHDIDGEVSIYHSPLTGLEPGVYVVLQRHRG